MSKMAIVAAKVAVVERGDVSPSLSSLPRLLASSSFPVIAQHMQVSVEDTVRLRASDELWRFKYHDAARPYFDDSSVKLHLPRILA